MEGREGEGGKEGVMWKKSETETITEQLYKGVLLISFFILPSFLSSFFLFLSKRNIMFTTQFCAAQTHQKFSRPTRSDVSQILTPPFPPLTRIHSAGLDELISLALNFRNPALKEVELKYIKKLRAAGIRSKDHLLSPAAPAKLAELIPNRKHLFSVTSLVEVLKNTKPRWFDLSVGETSIVYTRIRSIEVTFGRRHLLKIRVTNWKISERQYGTVKEEETDAPDMGVTGAVDTKQLVLEENEYITAVTGTFSADTAILTSIGFTIQSGRRARTWSHEADLRSQSIRFEKSSPKGYMISGIHVGYRHGDLICGISNLRAVISEVVECSSRVPNLDALRLVREKTHQEQIATQRYQGPNIRRRLDGITGEYVEEIENIPDNTIMMTQASPLNPPELHTFLTGPISLNVFSDPVICFDGHTYERKCIGRWLATEDKSPMTGETIPNKKLFPNVIVRRLLQGIQSDEAKEKERVRSLLMCPLSGTVFTDPVFLVADHLTYERSALAEFWSKNGSSRTPNWRRSSWGGNKREILPNHTIRALVSFARSNKEQTPKRKRGRADSYDEMWGGGLGRWWTNNFR